MRLRITFSKSGALRYTGHLDLQTTWERTVRRAGLPLAYTHGFHPGPRIQIASALPLGFIGCAEIVDIWLQDPVPALDGHTPKARGQADHSCVEALQSAAPPGLTILSVEPVAEAGPALQTQVASAEYAVTILDPVDESALAQRLAAALAAESLPRERRGKTYNLRPLLEELSILPAALPASATSRGKLRAVSCIEPREVQAETQELRVFMRLAARAGATARPEEVLDVLGIPLESARIARTRLILNRDME
jgi:radical SAM-linked protein